MEVILENIIKKTSSNKIFSYQAILLILLTFLEFISGFIIIALAYLEVWPEVTFTDVRGFAHHNITLNYDICRNSTNFTLTERRVSFINDFELYCKTFEISLIGTLFFIGVLVGSLFSHFLSDYFGRKKTLLIFSIVLIIVQIIFSLNHNLILFYVLLFFLGMLYIFIALSGIVLLNESIDMNKRSIFTSVVYVGFSVGGMIFSVLFGLIDNWRNVFHVVLVIHLIIFIIFWYFALESPRYYLSKGLNEEFKICIVEMTKKSGVDVVEMNFEKDFSGKI